MLKVQATVLEFEERATFKRVLPWTTGFSESEYGDARSAIIGLATNTEAVFRERWERAIAVLANMRDVYIARTNPEWWGGSRDANGNLIADLMIPEAQRALDAIADALTLADAGFALSDRTPSDRERKVLGA